MLRNTSYSQNQLRDYSSLFSRSEAKSWLKGDFSSINYKIKRYDEDWLNTDKVTYIDYLKHIYQVLESYYQNEYIYKNTFLNDWLIEEIGNNESRVFSEYRVGNAVADLVMFNGNSKVFEIKTKLDTNSRLILQLENYRKAFNQIYLIIPESKLSFYNKYNSEVGLLTFNSSHPERFTLEREAFENHEVEPDTIMDILHTHEYKMIVKNYFGKLPAMTSFNQFKICRELIRKIPNAKLNAFFIEAMKNRSMENALSIRYYNEFNQLSLALKFSKTERHEMIQNLKSKIII